MQLLKHFQQLLTICLYTKIQDFSQFNKPSRTLTGCWWQCMVCCLGIFSVVFPDPFFLYVGQFVLYTTWFSNVFISLYIPQCNTFYRSFISVLFIFCFVHFVSALVSVACFNGPHHCLVYLHLAFHCHVFVFSYCSIKSSAHFCCFVACVLTSLLMFRLLITSTPK